MTIDFQLVADRQMYRTLKIWDLLCKALNCWTDIQTKETTSDFVSKEKEGMIQKPRSAFRMQKL